MNDIKHRIESASAISLIHDKRIGEALCLIGKEVKLTNRQSQNIAISKEFWPKFNGDLKKAYLTQFGNWIKYAVTYKKGDELYYYCAIPKKAVVPEGFFEMDFPEQKYVVVEHRGKMDDIYKTYNRVYKEIIPQCGYVVKKDQFFHFEKYDYRFHWNREDSVIEIWVPIV